VALQTVARGEAPAREAVFAEGVLDMASARTATHRLVVRGLPLGEGSAERLAKLPLSDSSFDLHDVGRDPEELRDLLAAPGAQDEAMAERLREAMVSWRRSLAPPSGAFQAQVPAALEQGLRAQGYWTPDTP
jgi:hypothetical protein